ncbi:hypothetical protein LOK49_LG12G03058 [Camellia lanceoleosa]|uniref:Uncharacterized protein n=1 Tax=Camellia lanceoleosa TaxID=1840588 RepID=A0ACC0FR23_9ERIC|nr:hypothetical protein LOK49_LG12G03058 [Camellia lanceoleosa]
MGALLFCSVTRIRRFPCGTTLMRYVLLRFMRSVLLC